MTKTLLLTALLSLLPISELRGAIPFAYFNDIPLIYAFTLSVLVNMMAGPLAMVFLSTLHKWFYHIELYKNFFDKTVAKARAKIEKNVKKYGYLGLMIFVSIPLPVTGAWTGSLGAWVLGLDKKKSCLFVALGVLIAGIVVSLILMSGVGISSIFIKNVSI